MPLSFGEDAPLTKLAAPGWRAEIEIAGSWNGVIVLHATSDFAELLAKRMFDLGEECAATADQIGDCMREATNITAGNLKTVLPEPCSLSIPLSREIPEGGPDVRSGDPFLNLPFEAAGAEARFLLYKGTRS